MIGVSFNHLEGLRVCFFVQGSFFYLLRPPNFVYISSAFISKTYFVYIDLNRGNRGSLLGYTV
eukprot:c45750_g1_i1 orf=2-187(-)